ncbi:FHA domain containing protein [Tritrichomonas foetus]|uniref:E3 ubiquitin-protein ligase CHFR n=1 Tax=Tritrichomonas foetus TaxID=1144522 RepID=A0A1J4JZA1_9EUKA|nr:FHA domain containing protein [Tritrichomonas foetus]|eukprot:OHT04503.1 FHA domain containing protein [Tritrichomonas foetus]
MGIGVLLNSSKNPSPNAPKVIMLAQTVNKIGRQSEIKLDTEKSKEISKHHATIYQKVIKGKLIWIIEDQNSLNGTFVNGRKIHRVTIRHGDEIVFGGGAQFMVGDVVASTELGECRYLFFIPPPPVHFCQSVNVNASIMPENSQDICPICYFPITAAESLPCGHSFCLCCIHEWCRVCKRESHQCACPLCRTNFNPDELTPDEGLISEDSLDVYSVEPLLRQLEVKSCKVIKSVNIFKKWKKKHHAFFWKSFELIKDDDVRRTIFLHVTHVTLPYIVKATNQELKNAIENLGGKIKEKREDLLREVMFRMFALLIPIRKETSHSDAYKRIHELL